MIYSVLFGRLAINEQKRGVFFFRMAVRAAGVERNDAEDEQTDFQIIKLVMLGDSNVGKTSLVLRFVDNRFERSFISTMGMDFKTKELRLGNRAARVQIWDTAGQERFHAMVSAYYRGAQGALIVYDVCNAESFKNAAVWADKLTGAGGGIDTKIALVGNKCDCEAERTVSARDARSYAEQRGWLYMETSAKCDTNVRDVFERVCSACSARLDACGGQQRTSDMSMYNNTSPRDNHLVNKEDAGVVDKTCC